MVTQLDDVIILWRHGVTWLTTLLQFVTEFLKDIAAVTLLCRGDLGMTLSVLVTWWCHVMSVGWLNGSRQIIHDVRNVDVIKVYWWRSRGTTDGTHWRNLPGRTYRRTYTQTYTDRQTDRQTEYVNSLKCIDHQVQRSNKHHSQVILYCVPERHKSVS